MDFISKKELLEQTGISYGQLYRWKRQKLIPEEWFMKRASFTGQETFFPREQVLNRVRAILNAKDSYSLDELASMFSPESDTTTLLTSEEIVPNLVEASWLRRVSELTGESEFAFSEVVLIAAACETAEHLMLDDKGERELIQNVVSLFPEKPTGKFIVFGIGTHLHCAILERGGSLRFDASGTIRYECDLTELTGSLKYKRESFVKKFEGSSENAGY